MSMKRGLTVLLSGLFLLSMVSQAQAVPVGFSVNVGLTDGGTAQGTITLDTDFAAPLVAWSVETSGGGGPGFNYTGSIPAGGTDTSTASVNDTAGAQLNFTGVGGTSLIIAYTPSPLPLSGPTDLTVFELRDAQAPRFGGGTTSAVPEPGTIMLFGSGLLGLGLWRYRKNQKI